jgi:endonuclease/exonuclease/phosphatase family metal-dependent hydrolase
MGSRHLRVILLAFLLPMLAGAQKPLTLKVMTFNIRYDNPRDGLYSWAVRRPMVNAVIRNDNPEIIGFQEVLFSQLKELETMLPDYAHCGVGRDDGKQAGEFAPVFYRADRFKKKDEGTFWLSETPNEAGTRSWGAACNRIVTWVKLYDTRFKRKLFIFNTHFDHVSDEARVKSAELLLQAIRQLAKDEWVIVTGDFNDREGSPMYRMLTGTTFGLSLYNTSRISRAEPEGPSYTFVGFPFKPEEGYTIDFIFTRNNYAATVIRHAVITLHEGDLYPSDHLPVLAEFELKPKKKRYAIE